MQTSTMQCWMLSATPVSKRSHTHKEDGPPLASPSLQILRLQKPRSKLPAWRSREATHTSSGSLMRSHKIHKLQPIATHVILFSSQTLAYVVRPSEAICCIMCWQQLDTQPNTADERTNVCTYPYIYFRLQACIKNSTCHTDPILDI